MRAEDDLGLTRASRPLSSSMDPSWTRDATSRTVAGGSSDTSVTRRHFDVLLRFLGRVHGHRAAPCEGVSMASWQTTCRPRSRAPVPPSHASWRLYSSIVLRPRLLARLIILITNSFEMLLGNVTILFDDRQSLRPYVTRSQSVVS